MSSDDSVGAADFRRALALIQHGERGDEAGMRVILDDEDGSLRPEFRFSDGLDELTERGVVIGDHSRWGKLALADAVSVIIGETDDLETRHIAFSFEALQFAYGKIMIHARFFQISRGGVAPGFGEAARAGVQRRGCQRINHRQHCFTSANLRARFERNPAKLAGHWR